MILSCNKKKFEKKNIIKIYKYNILNNEFYSIEIYVSFSYM